jgi:hypothetical protein
MRFRQMLPFLRFAQNQQSFGRQGSSPLQVKPRIIFSRYIRRPAPVFYSPRRIRVNDPNRHVLVSAVDTIHAEGKQNT